MFVDFEQGKLTIQYPYNPTYDAIMGAFPNRPRRRAGKFWTEAAVPAFAFIATHFPTAEFSPAARAEQDRCRAILQTAQAIRSAKTEGVAVRAAIRQRSYKLKPWEHQFKALELSVDLCAFALFMEQRTGKTKVVLDTADILYEQGLIDALVIFAPNGVHENWVRVEIPQHLQTAHSAAVWYAAPKAAERKALDAILNSKFDGLKVLAVNIEAMSTERAAATIEQFVRSHKCCVVMDEGHWIKTPGATRTKALIKVARLAQYKRLLTGTPVTQGYEDLYSQFAFLDEQILGYTSFYSYKAQYCVEREATFANSERPVKLIVGYKNVEELKKRIDGYSFTVTRDECFDLPGVVYGKRHVELSKEQWKHYQELRDELITEINNMEVTALLPITKLIRLRQVLGGFLGNPDVPGSTIPIPGPNPKLIALQDELTAHHGQTIIWAVFRHELDLISRALKVPYYPGSEDRELSTKMVADFQSGKLKYFVANPRKAGTGLKLPARDIVWFSNGFSLADRLQADDRPIFEGMKHKLGITDLVATKTVDEHIIEALRGKRDIANVMSGREIKSWL